MAELLEMAGTLQADFTSSQPRVLIAEDQPHVLEALHLLLKSEGFGTELANSPLAVLHWVRRMQFDAVLMDLNYARDTTSGREGLDLLKELLTHDPTLPVVVMTAWGTVDLAVEAMHRGARDFVQKPWENARLLAILRTQIEEGRARRLEQRRLDRENEDAAQTQHGLLPRQMPAIPGFEVAVEWKPARTVGGDYYDLLQFTDTIFGFAIGDVAGKGVPAALLMSNLQATLRAFASADAPAERLCRRINEVIGANTAMERFITLFYGRLDAEQRQIEYVCAGHCAPILVRHDGAVERLRVGGGVIGGFGDGHYQAGVAQLRPGDRLLLFTDGISEAKDDAGEEFGETRLAQVAAAQPTRSADALRKAVMQAVDAHCRGQFHDDATLIVLAAQ